MNKKYFTNYLPVEGEIKEGDYWCSTTGNFYLVKDKEHAKKINQKKFEETRNKSWYSKGKLFLCSRDIQGGDKYFTYNHDKEFICHHKENNFLYPNEGWRTVFTNAYKVIGEISPDAIWVKEGDEFDEDELEWSINGENYEWEFVDRDNLQNYLIKIKCSQCKTYH